MMTAVSHKCLLNLILVIPGVPTTLVPVIPFLRCLQHFSLTGSLPEFLPLTTPSLLLPKFQKMGKRDRTVDTAVALHMTDPCSVPRRVHPPASQIAP